MKVKGLLIIMLIFMLVSTACGEQGNNAIQSSEMVSEKVKIVTSFYPIYIMTLNVTKDIPGVEVVNMTKPFTGCLHDYQMTTDDMKSLQDAQIMIVNGAGMEPFLDKVIKQQPHVKIIEASSGLDLLTNESDGEPNPHLWVSISCAMAQVQKISEQLSAIDPVRGKAYEENASAYVQKLASLRTEMHQVLDSIPNRNIITFHEAFPYFAQEFNLNIAAVIEREPGAEPSAGELARIISTINETGIKALFAEPQYPPEAAEVIARETGARVYYLDPGVTGPMDPNAYITIMKKNLDVLQEALK